MQSWLWEGRLGPLGPDLEQGDLAFIVSLSSRALTGKPGPRSWWFMDEARAGFSGVWRGLSGRDGVTPAKHWGVCGR